MSHIDTKMTNNVIHRNIRVYIAPFVCFVDKRLF